MEEVKEQIILTNMCMIIDEKNNKVVCIDRLKGWKGIAFPGGHIEQGEPIYLSMIREVKEETNLDIINLKLVGVRDWYEKDKNLRNIVFIFRTTSFKGELSSGTEEGKVFWLPIEDLHKVKLAEGFDQEIDLFEDNNNVTEIYSDNIMGLNYKKY